jgi:hypothetical protein
MAVSNLSMLDPETRALLEKYAEQEQAKGLVDSVLALGSRAAGMVPQGWAGLTSGGMSPFGAVGSAIGALRDKYLGIQRTPGVDRAVDAMQSTGEFIEPAMYSPAGEAAQSNLQAIAKPFELAGKAIEAIPAAAELMPSVGAGDVLGFTAPDEYTPSPREARAVRRTAPALTDLSNKYFGPAVTAGLYTAITAGGVPERAGVKGAAEAAAKASAETARAAGKLLPVESRAAADAALGRGHRVYVQDEMSGGLTEVRDAGVLDGYTADQIFTRAPDPAPTGKRAARNVKKGVIVSVRELPPDEALSAAESGAHLKQGTTGQYIGAPRGLNTPGKLDAMRRKFDKLVEKGVEGADWYERARNWNLWMARNDPKKASLLADEEALWSAQSDPNTNLQFALQGHNAYEAGAPLGKVKTTGQANKYIAARDAGVPVKQGPKTGIYKSHLDPSIDPWHTGTNDIWHARAFGYGEDFSRGLTAQEHAFLDAETMLAAARANKKKLGGTDTWNAGMVQAAPWVYSKAVGLMKKYPKRFPDLPSALAEARSTYPEYAPNYVAFGTHEAQPGRGTGHITESETWTPEQRAQYASDPRSQWTDETGRDAIYNALGMYQLPTNEATGYFIHQGQLETNPARAARPLVSSEVGDAGRQVGNADRGMMDAAESLRAYLDAQNAGAWHKYFLGEKAGNSTSVRIPMTRALDEAEMRRLSEVASKHGFGISDTGDGVTLMNNSSIYAEPPGPTAKGLTNLLKKGSPSKAVPNRGELSRDVIAANLPLNDVAIPGTRVKLDSGYQDYSGAFAAGEGSGQATSKLFGDVKREDLPAMFAKLDESPEIRQAALNRLERDAAQNGAREDVQLAREIIAKHGLRGLHWAWEHGVKLPAFLLAMFGLEQVTQEGSSGA